MPNKRKYDFEKYRIESAKRDKIRAQKQIEAAEAVLAELDGKQLESAQGNGTG